MYRTIRDKRVEDVDVFYDAFDKVTVLGDDVIYIGGDKDRLKRGKVEKIIRTTVLYDAGPPKHYWEIHVRFRAYEKGRPGVGKLEHPERIARAW
jgi:hypothetical protein